MHDLLRPAYRKVVADDIPWMLSLAHERYGAFDPGGALSFLLQALNSPLTLLLRSCARDAFLIAATVTPPWYPTATECHVMVLCAKPGAHWQAIKLLRGSVEWARLRKCVRWRFHSETQHDVAALCRRIGATPDSPRYVIDL